MKQLVKWKSVRMTHDGETCVDVEAIDAKGKQVGDLSMVLAIDEVKNFFGITLKPGEIVVGSFEFHETEDPKLHPKAGATTQPVDKKNRKASA